MEPLSGTELFLLMLISQGLGTPYDFKAEAGLSVGSTALVLARLEKAGLVAAGKPGVRGSRRFTITKAGEKTLRSEWRGLLQVRPTAIEEALRVIYLAWSAGESVAAGKFADQAAADLLARAVTKKAEAAEVRPHTSSKRPGETFRWLKLRVEAAEAEADARMLGEVKQELMGNKKNKAKK
jgi:DNA-binding PadR family transcriptional regulator